VTAHYNSNFAGLESFRGEERVHVAQADLTSEADVARLFQDASAKFGPVQIAVVNHGVYPSQDMPLAEMTLEQWCAFRAHAVCLSLTGRTKELYDEPKPYLLLPRLPRVSARDHSSGGRAEGGCEHRHCRKHRGQVRRSAACGLRRV
jgi:hypothetical protein